MMAGLKKRGPASRRPKRSRRDGPCNFPDKKRFRFLADAEHALLIMQFKGKAGLDVHAYSCNAHFHLGHDRRLTRLVERLRRAA